MTLDHWNIILGGSIYMRILGRLAFPIFSFLIGEGYRHTRNKKNYFLKIFFYSVLLQIPVFLFYSSNEDLNIFFTLATGILFISILENNKMNKLTKFLLVLFLVIGSEYFKFDYGAYGVLSIVIFYNFRERKQKIFWLFLFINIVYIYLDRVFLIQIFSLFSLFLIFKYNGKEGIKNSFISIIQLIYCCYIY